MDKKILQRSKDIIKLERRLFLKGSLSLGALTMLTGGRSARKRLLGLTPSPTLAYRFRPFRSVCTRLLAPLAGCATEVSLVAGIA